jgi:hypothetical protein
MLNTRKTDADPETDARPRQARTRPMTRPNRRLGGAVLALGMLLLTAMAPAAQAGSAACTLSVTPESGPPGTEFVFSGSGYTPTTLTLRQDGKPPRVVPLDLGTADPFSIPLLATQSDVGKWKVVASTDNPACSGIAEIKVTLPSTATIDAPDPALPNQDPAIAAFAGLAVLFLVSTQLLYRRSRIRRRP